MTRLTCTARGSPCARAAMTAARYRGAVGARRARGARSRRGIERLLSPPIDPRLEVLKRGTARRAKCGVVRLTSPPRSPRGARVLLLLLNTTRTHSGPPRDMWDRLTTPTPTVTLESTFRQPSRFAVLLFLDPPVPLVVSPVFPRCTGVCVFVPCGILRGSCPSEWSRERSAPSSVARVCRLTPPYTRTTLCLLSLLHHRRRWVSLTYHVRTVHGASQAQGRG